MNRTTSKKPAGKKPRRRSTGIDFVRSLKIVDNIPAGDELAINEKEFVQIFKSDIQKKLFKK